ncbi:hypothetical protein BS78_10G193000 [Paspalum vaginatum]|nr:hypothetical protein BS78_10G193000 [Paspalum vaginatum]
MHLLKALGWSYGDSPDPARRHPWRGVASASALRDARPQSGRPRSDKWAEPPPSPCCRRGGQGGRLVAGTLPHRHGGRGPMADKEYVLHRLEQRQHCSSSTHGYSCLSTSSLFGTSCSDY